MTETDKANEKLIFDAVREKFPEDELIGEVNIKNRPFMSVASSLDEEGGKVGNEGGREGEGG